MATPDLDKMGEGIQLLREYVAFNGFNFLKHCQQYDKLDTGKLTTERFELALKESNFRFTEKYVKDIINDAPKTKRNDICYRDLWFVISKAPKPKTRIGARQQASETSLLNELANIGDVAVEKDVKQFFRNKQLYDLQHYELNQLRLDALRHDADPNASATDKAVFNIYAHNNDLLMSNFSVKVAQDIYQKVCPSGVPLKEKQIRDIFQQFLRRRNEDMYSSISEIEFNKIMQQFTIKLTQDEANLLYIIVHKEFAENVLTITGMVEWITVYHTKRMKIPINIDDYLKNQGESLQKKIEMPDVMMKIIKVISEVGFEKFQHALDFISKKKIDKIEFQAMAKFLKTYEILISSPEDMNGFKMYLAQEGALDMTNPENITQSQIVISFAKFVELLRTICMDLFIPVTHQKLQIVDLDDAYTTFNKAIYLSYWNQIKERMIGFCDNFGTISELRIKEVLKTMIPTLDNHLIDTLLDDLKHTQKVQQDNLQNMIFVDEFIANIENTKFTQKQNFRKIEEPVAERTSPPKKPQEFDTNTQFFKPKPAQSEVDTTAVLSKLQNVLKDLLESNVMNIKPEESGILTLPLLKIIKSYDTSGTGVMDSKVFRTLLIECFPIFTHEEIMVLVGMAEKISTAPNTGEQDPNKPQVKSVSYFHFLMQLEKYYGLQAATSQ